MKKRVIELPKIPTLDHVPGLTVQRDILEQFEQDAAALKGRNGAVGLLSPRNIEELQYWLAFNPKQYVLAQGSMTSLTGGSTPDGDVVIHFDHFKQIQIDATNHRAQVGAGVTLQDLQQSLRKSGLFFPPAPTYGGASIGGMLSTNAAGAATFKYGTTRDWVESLTVLLRSGHCLTIKRGEVVLEQDDEVVFKEKGASCELFSFKLPSYRTPNLKKISSGYYVKSSTDLVDLLIGSEGTLVIIVDVVLRLIDLPKVSIGLSFFSRECDAISFTEELRQTELARSIECFDKKSIELVQKLGTVSMQIPSNTEMALLYEIEFSSSDDDKRLDELTKLLTKYDCLEASIFAMPDEVRKQTELIAVREQIPLAVSEFLHLMNKKYPAIHKVAGDFIVPFEHFSSAMNTYRKMADHYKLEMIIFGHISDGNVHPNFLPRTPDDMSKAKQCMRDIASEVKGLGGAPMSEHGVGKHPLKKQLLIDYWGDDVIEQMSELKRRFDPNWTLGRGILF